MFNCFNGRTIVAVGVGRQPKAKKVTAGEIRNQMQAATQVSWESRFQLRVNRAQKAVVILLGLVDDACSGTR